MNPRGARFSDDGVYRYNLWRIRGDGAKGVLGFIMLNPSTADAENDDPTIARCLKRAFMLGFDGIEIGNLYAYRATDPKKMKAADDPVGTENDKELAKIASRCDMIILGWGNHAEPIRAKEVMEELRGVNSRLFCLGMTKSGQPKHPLYVGYDVEPIRI